MSNERLKKWALKIKVLTYYGNDKLACVRCGFDDIRALSLDHIKGDGSKHRKEVKTGSMYIWVMKNNYPKGFQTLCYNCQRIKYIDEDSVKNKVVKVLLVDRIQAWIDARGSKFKLQEIATSLALTKKEYNTARSIMWRFVREGRIKSLEIRKGYYIRLAPPIMKTRYVLEHPRVVSEV